MTIRARLTLYSLLFAATVAAALIWTGLLAFQSEVDQLQEVVYRERLERFVALAREQDNLYFEGVVKTQEEARERVIDRFRVYYREHPDAEVFPYVQSMDGVVVAHPRVPRQATAQALHPLSPTDLLKSRDREFVHTYRGCRRWEVFEFYKPWGWVFLYSVPLDVKDAAVARSRNRQAAQALLYLALAVPVFFLLIRAALKPLRRLEQSAEALSRGDFDAVEAMPVSSADEIGAVSEAFRRMGAEVRDAMNRLREEVDKRRAVAEALEASQERFRDLFENAPVGYHEIDAQGRVVQVNGTELQMLGYSLEEMRGRFVWEFVADSATSRQAVLDKLAGRAATTQALERVFVRKDGSQVQVLIEDRILRDSQGAITGIRSTLQDISRLKAAEAEREHLQEQIQQAQKIESLGVLAGGIAHDFNNLLVGILGNADLALHELPPDSPARESIKSLEHAATRAADLCRQMLAYSGKGKFVVEIVQINEIVLDTYPLMRASVSKSIAIGTELSDDTPPVEADATQLRQVLMNLVTNAAEAIESKRRDRHGEDRIVIRSGREECTGESFRDTVGADAPPPGLYAYLEVSDTGTGMDEETRQRVFEPFFSTKFTGRGLGMAAVLGIVRGHQGAMRVDSQPGRGTTMRLLLPAKEVEADLEAPGGAPATEPVRADEVSPLSIEPLVLVVDDDQGVAAVARQVLERNGFQVHCACDGKDAVDWMAQRGEAKKAPKPVACVLLDLTMPRMDGVATLEHLRRIQPDVAVVLTSGYDRHETMRRFGADENFPFVHKPYRADDLLEAVRQARRGA